MPKLSWACWPALTMLALAVGCNSAATDREGGAARTIRIDGSSTVYLISAMTTELYHEQNAGAKIVVGFSGTGGGMKKFLAGEIDICDASRRIKPEEIEAGEKAGVEFIELEVAYDGLAVVVSPRNDWCDCLTVEQLKKLWEPGSTVKTWRDIDPRWPNEEIALYGPGTDSGTFEYFTEAIVGEAKSSRPDYVASEDDNVLVKGVESDQYALGYFGFAYYVENKKLLKLLGVNAGDGCVQPTLETVSQNVYRPLSRPLYIYVRQSSLQNPAMVEFVKYYLEHAAEVSKEVGYVPVKPEIQDANLQKLGAAIEP